MARKGAARFAPVITHGRSCGTQQEHLSAGEAHPNRSHNDSCLCVPCSTGRYPRLRPPSAHRMLCFPACSSRRHAGLCILRYQTQSRQSSHGVDHVRHERMPVGGRGWQQLEFSKRQMLRRWAASAGHLQAVEGGGARLFLPVRDLRASGTTDADFAATDL